VTIHPPKYKQYRKKGDEQVQVQFRAPAALRKRLYDEAARREVSVNYLIERAVIHALDRWEKDKL
jgi:hypothetical protein